MCFVCSLDVCLVVSLVRSLMLRIIPSGLHLLCLYYLEKKVFPPPLVLPSSLPSPPVAPLLTFVLLPPFLLLRSSFLLPSFLQPLTFLKELKLADDTAAEALNIAETSNLLGIFLS